MQKSRIYAEKPHMLIWKVNSSVPPDRINDFENVNCTNCECSETDYILHLMYLWWLCRNPDIYLPTSSRQTCLLEVWFQFGLVAHRVCLCPLLGKYLFLHQQPLFISTRGSYLEINRISAGIQYFRAQWVYTPKDPLKVFFKVFLKQAYPIIPLLPLSALEQPASGNHSLGPRGPFVLPLICPPFCGPAGTPSPPRPAPQKWSIP